jgi:hypothetical protein
MRRIFDKPGSNEPGIECSLQAKGSSTESLVASDSAQLSAMPKVTSTGIGTVLLGNGQQISSGRVTAESGQSFAGAALDKELRKRLSDRGTPNATCAYASCSGLLGTAKDHFSSVTII